MVWVVNQNLKNHDILLLFLYYDLKKKFYWCLKHSNKNYITDIFSTEMHTLKNRDKCYIINLNNYVGKIFVYDEIIVYIFLGLKCFFYSYPTWNSSVK